VFHVEQHAVGAFQKLKVFSGKRSTSCSTWNERCNSAELDSPLLKESRIMFHVEQFGALAQDLHRISLFHVKQLAPQFGLC
jgi:hypothetical protein